MRRLRISSSHLFLRGEGRTQLVHMYIQTAMYVVYSRLMIKTSTVWWVLENEFLSSTTKNMLYDNFQLVEKPKLKSKEYTPFIQYTVTDSSSGNLRQVMLITHNHKGPLLMFLRAGSIFKVPKRTPVCVSVCMLDQVWWKSNLLTKQAKHHLVFTPIIVLHLYTQRSTQSTKKDICSHTFLVL